MEDEQVFAELIQLSQKKEIPYTRKQLEKLSPEKLQQIYEEYKRKELDDLNEALADVAISKIDEVLKKYEFINQDSQLGKKLQNKKLFKQDLKSLISYVTPVLPFIGFIEGSVTIAAEVFDKVINDNPTPKTQERNEQDQDPASTYRDPESPED